MILTPASTALRRANRRAGFTLLEVLVVVAILVILSTVAVISTMTYLETARKSRAQLQCKSLAQTIEAYYVNPQSGNQYPTSLQDLLTPPFGGGSMLKNGQDDLVDPWGQQYQVQFIQGQDGNQVPLVYTNAKDGTPISQYGAGPLSKMQ
ncbi:prepilin-type N-terminal cleavage/methylation domain-containing protein [Urbifossiella limnaea]|uniref:Type II secretion system protein G n=1 Tax=Urbifossiella limnaea TaxID=2528023 RepID=A0A517XL10_9BACT|nr:prepilin-type N-terminal cleavage/methylation domain-containing protein [Urbifossiella limnaea]QDU18198.1 Type II secretion system protein G precursor [Urbifossiella limnaea]